jgi:hypothetical protein
LPPEEDAPIHPEPGEHPNEAMAAVVEGSQRRSSRGSRSAKSGRRTPREGQEPPEYTPRPRAAGWLRAGQLEGNGLATSQLRDQARRILEVDFLPYLQELIADHRAKDVDRLRAGDIVAKISVGYITPDMMNAEDAPELPPPIFETSDGELPGDSAPMYDDAEPTMATAGADAAPDAAGAA